MVIDAQQARRVISVSKAHSGQHPVFFIVCMVRIVFCTWTIVSYGPLRNLEMTPSCCSMQDTGDPWGPWLLCPGPFEDMKAARSVLQHDMFLYPMGLVAAML